MLFFSLRERSSQLGKNLKGKEIGKGIYQRKDGLYSARFVDKIGSRHQKYFKTYKEADCKMDEAVRTDYGLPDSVQFKERLQNQ